MLVSMDQSSDDTYQSLSLAVINAVAEQEGVDPTDIEPPTYESLYSVVNPEALDSLFAPRSDGTPRTNGKIEFQFCGYDIVVTSDGTVELTE